MKIGLLSDIHGNLPALKAVLKKLRQEGCEKLFCGGDIVGYGAFPEECVNLLRENDVTSVRGNHDHMVAHPGREMSLRSEVQKAITWSREQLSDETLHWLGNLPLELEAELVNMVHASHLIRPEWHYVVDGKGVCSNFLFQTHAISFNGHTHLPLLAQHKRKNRPRLIHLQELELPKGGRYLINVGSVGQPRDHDPRAACVIYEPEKGYVALHRVEYDILQAQEAIRKARLPRFFATRLSEGK